LQKTVVGGDGCAIVPAAFLLSCVNPVLRRRRTKTKGRKERTNLFGWEAGRRCMWLGGITPRVKPKNRVIGVIEKANGRPENPEILDR